MQKTACQKPAEIVQEIEITSSVEKNSYKYYRVNLEEQEDNKFTIELSMVKGKTELFHSFTDENPKSKDDYINPNNFIPDREGNFFERMLDSVNDKIKRLSKRSIDSPNETELRNYEKVYYQIEKPEQEPNEVLYFSVRGLDETNEFQIYIYNRTVYNNANSILVKQSYGLFLVQGLLFIIFMKMNF